MWQRTRFDIATEYEQDLIRHDLNDFDRLMHAEIGDVVVREPFREVRRIDLPDGNRARCLYLKRCTHQALRKSLRSWRRFTSPHIENVREYRMVDALRRAGMPVMEPIAWGEQRVLGFPRRGFLLVRGVEGIEVTAILARPDHPNRKPIIEAIGRLLGRLHGCGFYEAVRPRDLICTTQSAQAEATRLVLIDRESDEPTAQAFSADACCRARAKCHCKMHRSGFDLSKTERLRLMRSYLASLDATWSARPRESIDRISPYVARYTAPGSKYEGLQ